MLKWLLPRRIKRVHIYFIVATLLLGYYYWTRIIRLRSAQSPSFQEVNRTPKMDIWTARQQEVVAAFRHSWDGYEKYAWGYDELKPVAKEGSDWFHLGLTIIDSLDTSYMMGQMDIFQKARDWTADNLEFKADVNANVFEITIRVLGGLLSAHHLSKDPMFLVKAIELADELLIAFKSPSEIPYSSVNFLHKKAAEAHFDQGASSTSEATTLQLEFKYLTHLTGDPKYWNACQKAMRSVLKNDRPSGLVPIFIDAKTGNFAGNNIRLGSRGDSYYG